MSYGAPPRPGLSVPRDWPVPAEGVAPRGQAPPPPPLGRRGHAPSARQGTCRGGASAGSLALGAPPLPAPLAGAASPSGERRRRRAAARAWAARPARRLRSRLSPRPAAPEGAAPAGLREGPVHSARLRASSPPLPGASTPARPCISPFRVPKSPSARALDLMSLRPSRCPQRRALLNTGRERELTAGLAWAGCCGKGGQVAFPDCHDCKKFF